MHTACKSTRFATLATATAMPPLYMDDGGEHTTRGTPPLVHNLHRRDFLAVREEHRVHIEGYMHQMFM